MKNILFSICLLLAAFLANAQVYSGSAEINGNKKDGFYIYLNAPEDIVYSSWKNYVKDFGAIDKSKNFVLSAINVKIPSIDLKDLQLVSKVNTEASKVKLFVSLYTLTDQIKSGHDEYRKASDWLEAFSLRLSKEENVRAEQAKLDVLLKNKAKFERVSDRLARDMESNTSHIEFLQKKLEDAKMEKERIITNKEQNKLDLQKVEAQVVEQRKNLETAKQQLK